MRTGAIDRVGDDGRADTRPAVASSDALDGPLALADFETGQVGLSPVTPLDLHVPRGGPDRRDRCGGAGGDAQPEEGLAGHTTGLPYAPPAVGRRLVVRAGLPSAVPARGVEGVAQGALGEAVGALGDRL